MNIVETKINGVFAVETSSYVDSRGSFTRNFCKDTFALSGIEMDFVQINQSVNTKKGTFRGLHFQVAPSTEKKLVKCALGAALDVVLDMRTDSPTFLQHLIFEISSENGKVIVVPEGVAHGFLTLTDHTIILYHHTENYDPIHERGVRHDDPRIDLQLPFPILQVSDRDLKFPLL